MYFVITKTANMSVTGRMPFTAANVLAFIKHAGKQANGHPAEIIVRDESGNAVSIERLRKEAEDSETPARGGSCVRALVLLAMAALAKGMEDGQL